MQVRAFEIKIPFTLLYRHILRRTKLQWITLAGIEV